MATPIKLNSHAIRIKAPRELVYQTMSHFGRGRIKGDNNESVRVICRTDDTIIAEFRSKAWLKTYTTIEEVGLEPPERITFKHLSGPLDYAWEEFVFTDVDGETELVHNGEFIWKNIPLVGWLGGVIYTRRAFESVVAEHMEQLKIATEARAARSHVFGKRGASVAQRE